MNAGWRDALTWSPWLTGAARWMSECAGCGRDCRSATGAPRTPGALTAHRALGIAIRRAGPRGDAGAALGVPEGLPVVIGAGDRPCEVLGTGALDTLPMVSWGTTANVSVPVDAVPTPLLPTTAKWGQRRHVSARSPPSTEFELGPQPDSHRLARVRLRVTGGVLGGLAEQGVAVPRTA